ncbi:hypothetical protein K2227_12380 [Shewanella putrefaciens]|jgi:hypothetical protein|nr:hypothetical protein K2227_12380 [Shewanella putrefaciens]
MGQIIKFPLEKKIQTDEFHSAIDELDYPSELKEQLRLDILPYLEKYSKLIISDLQMEIPNNLSVNDEELIISQVKVVLQEQLKYTQQLMLKDIVKLAVSNSKLKFNAKNI